MAQKSFNEEQTILFRQKFDLMSHQQNRKHNRFFYRFAGNEEMKKKFEFDR